jgi:type IV pilus assembly protein PilF
MKLLYNLFTIFISSLLLFSCSSTNHKPSTEELELGIDRENNANFQQIKTYIDLGAEYMRLGKYTIAIHNLEKALTLAPNNANAQSTMAVLYAKLNKKTLAKKYYLRSIELAPNRPLVQNNYATFLCDDNQVLEAEKYFIKAAKNPLYETPELAYTNAGICILRINQNDRAEEYFHQALTIHKDYLVAVFQLAQLNYKNAHYNKAHEYMQRYEIIRVKQKYPHRSTVLWLGIQIERALGNEDAETNYAFLLKSNFPDNKETLLLNRNK